jgi:hypothetical protein
MYRLYFPNKFDMVELLYIYTVGAIGVFIGAPEFS